MGNLPKRITLSRAKGWRMPPNTVKVDRSTKFGNPWSISGAREAGYKGSDCDLARWCVELFRDWLSGREVLIGRWPPGADEISTLRGKNLACWCKQGEPCHADVLLEIANRPTQSEDADD